MKKKLLLLMSIFMLVGMMASSVALGSDYIGNSNSYKFHYASCRWVQKMSDNHKVYFESRDEAIDAGYVPCKVCRP